MTQNEHDSDTETSFSALQHALHACRFPQMAVLIRIICREGPFLAAKRDELFWHELAKGCSTTQDGAGSAHVSDFPLKKRGATRRKTEEVNAWEGSTEGLWWRTRKEEEKFSLDQKTNNDSSYNRNKPSERCQTQALQEKETFPFVDEQLSPLWESCHCKRLRPFHVHRCGWRNSVCTQKGV